MSMTVSRTDDISAQARIARAVALSDTVDLPLGPARGLWVGGPGNVVALLVDDMAPVTFVVQAAPVVLPCIIKRVLVTGTTATGLIALY